MTTTFAAYRAINEYVTFEGKTYLGTSLGNGHFSVAVKTIKGTYRRIASNRIIDAVTALVKAQVEVKAQQRAFLERTEATIAQNTTPLAKVLEQIPTLPAAPAAERAKEHFAAMKAEIERVRAKAAAELAELDLLTPEENAQVDAYRARVQAEEWEALQRAVRMELKAAKEKYVAIRLWGERLGSFDGYINEVQLQALRCNAPADALYERNGVWCCVSDLKADHDFHKAYAKRLKAAA